MSSWIDRALQSAEIRRLHSALLDQAPALRGRVGALPALVPDAGVQTYWERRPSGSVSVGHIPTCNSPEALTAGLAAFWRDRDQPELASLAPVFAALAEHLKGLVEPMPEPPRLVYTLF